MPTSCKNLIYIYLQIDETRTSSKPLRVFSYSFRGLISSFISLILILEVEYYSGGDLVIMQISRSDGVRERSLKIRNVLPENLGPTKNVD